MYKYMVVLCALIIAQIASAADTEWQKEVKMNCAAIGSKAGKDALSSREKGEQLDFYVTVFEDAAKDADTYTQEMFKITIKIFKTIYKSNSIKTIRAASDEGYKICVNDWLKFDPDGSKRKAQQTAKVKAEEAESQKQDAVNKRNTVVQYTKEKTKQEIQGKDPIKINKALKLRFGAEIVANEQEYFDAELSACVKKYHARVQQLTDGNQYAYTLPKSVEDTLSREFGARKCECDPNCSNEDN